MLSKKESTKEGVRKKVNFLKINKRGALVWSGGLDKIEKITKRGRRLLGT